MPTYPKNAPFEIESLQNDDGTPNGLSRFCMGTHTATHMDAPKHVRELERSEGTDIFSLNTLVGVCRVLDFSHVTEYISLEDVKGKHIQFGERILAKTLNSSRDWKEFYSDFVYLHGDAAEYLARVGVKLFGIDYLSVKQRGSADNRSHTGLLKSNIAIIEGLDLSMVEEGEYELIALPLKILDADGTPIRAVLRR